MPEKNNASDKSMNMARSVSPGVYDATVSLRTRDLPNWTITKTTDRLKWIVYSGGSVDWLYWYVRWYAVNPSPIDTHWYITYNTHWGPYFGSGSTNVSKDVYGVYHNYDWGGMMSLLMYLSMSRYKVITMQHIPTLGIIPIGGKTHGLYGG